MNDAYKTITAIDLNMAWYYHLPLDEWIHLYFPSAHFRYHGLWWDLMIAQICFRKKWKVVSDQPNGKVCMDDILVLTQNTYHDHWQRIDWILHHLQSNHPIVTPAYHHVQRKRSTSHDFGKEILPQPKKIQINKQWSQPITPTASQIHRIGKLLSIHTAIAVHQLEIIIIGKQQYNN